VISSRLLNTNSAYGQYQCHTFFVTTTFMLAAKDDEYFCRGVKHRGFSTSSNMMLGRTEVLIMKFTMVAEHKTGGVKAHNRRSTAIFNKQELL
jgi:hypothetical protein